MKLIHKLIMGLGFAVLFNIIIFIFGIRQQYRAADDISLHDAIDIATMLEQAVSLEFGDLSISENLLRLQKYLLTLGQVSGRDIAIVNRDRIVIADTEQEQDEVGKEFFPNHTQVIQTMQDGKPRFFTEFSRDFPHGIDQIIVPLYDRTKTPEEIFGAIITSYEEPDLTQTKKIFFAVSVVIILIAAAIGITLIYGIYQPIMTMKKAVVEIGKGRLDTKINIKTKDEIGELAHSFNDMAQNLQKTMTSVENLNREIAERKHTQAELQKLNAELGRMNTELQESNEKLEAANSDLKNFVYIASHDLREPLRKISMFGIMLQNSLKDKLAAADAENLHFMIDGAKRMTQMIEGLLVYSRVSTQPHPFQMVDMNEIVRQICSIELAAVIEEKNVIIDIPKPLAAVEADPVQMRQLMQNLIANGIKYQPKGARPRITITSQPADDMIRIEVADNGIGIKPEHHSAVFEMFKRLHTRGEYEGTGIGLAVCKRIVDRHNGKIGVESQYGKGSAFWFTVPAVKSSVSVPTAV